MSNLWADTHLDLFAEDLNIGAPFPADAPDLDDVIDTWQALDDLHRTLGVVRDEWANHLAARLAELPGYNKREGITSAEGNTVHHTRDRRYSWDGRGVLRALGYGMIDTATGELVKAVPVDRLEQCIAGVLNKDGDPAGYSSWRAPALRNLDVDPDAYRTVSREQVTVRRGGAKR